MKRQSHLLPAGLVLGMTYGAWAQPIITNQPQNQSAVAGTTATFTVGATGAEPLNYQWRSHSSTTIFTNIPFGKEAVLVLTNVDYTTRRFSVVVTNADGAATSSPLVFITWLLAITSQPADQIMDSGATVTFTAAATGTAPLGYQWRFNDADLAGQTNRSFVLFGHTFSQTVRSLPGGNGFPTADRSIPNQSLQHPHEQFVHGDVLVSSRGQSRSAPGGLR